MLDIVLLHYQPANLCQQEWHDPLAMTTIQLPSHAPCAPQNSQQAWGQHLWVMGQQFGHRWQHRRQSRL